MEESNPNTYPKETTGKGWMICSIVLFVAVIALTIIVATTGVKSTSGESSNKVAELEQQVKDKDAKIAELQSSSTEITDEDTKNEIENLKKQIEEKDAKIANLESTQSSTSSSAPINVNISDIVAAAKKAGVADSMYEIKIMKYQDSNYIVAAGQATKGTSGHYQFMYKENTNGAEWKDLLGTQAEISCSSLSDLQKQVLKGVESCTDESGYRKTIGL